MYESLARVAAGRKQVQLHGLENEERAVEVAGAWHKKYASMLPINGADMLTT